MALLYSSPTRMVWFCRKVWAGLCQHHDSRTTSFRSSPLNCLILGGMFAAQWVSIHGILPEASRVGHWSSADPSVPLTVSGMDSSDPLHLHSYLSFEEEHDHMPGHLWEFSDQWEYDKDSHSWPAKQSDDHAYKHWPEWFASELQSELFRQSHTSKSTVFSWLLSNGVLWLERIAREELWLILYLKQVTTSSHAYQTLCFPTPPRLAKQESTDMIMKHHTHSLAIRLLTM